MNKDIYILIGKNISKYRIKKGYTLKDLSITTNLDINYLDEIEKNGVDGNITFDELNKICKSLEINMINLFENEKK